MKKLSWAAKLKAIDDDRSRELAKQKVIDEEWGANLLALLDEVKVGKLTYDEYLAKQKVLHDEYLTEQKAFWTRQETLWARQKAFLLGEVEEL
jgi:hypothetical protein